MINESATAVMYDNLSCVGGSRMGRVFVKREVRVAETLKTPMQRVIT